MPLRNQAALDFLKSRRSRPAKLFSLPVPDREALAEILTAALRVPDHGKLEPWRLIVVQGAAFARLADLADLAAPGAPDGAMDPSTAALVLRLRALLAARTDPGAPDPA